VPEHYVQSHGKQTVRLDTSRPGVLKKFIKELGAAISQDMTDIHETELDRSGGYEKITLLDMDEHSEGLDALVDRLGRVVIPVQERSWEIKAVIVSPATIRRRVVRTETRYLGDRPVAMVLYLESEETNA
jgi:hypothetical protein